MFDCGYRYDPRDGQYKMLDVNPRVGANFRQCVGHDGLDVVRAMYLDLTGEPVPADIADEGRRWWVENYDLLAGIGLRRAGSLTARRWLASVRRADEPAWYARDDMAPFRTTCIRMAQAGARRALSLEEKLSARPVHRRLSMTACPRQGQVQGEPARFAAVPLRPCPDGARSLPPATGAGRERAFRRRAGSSTSL